MCHHEHAGRHTPRPGPRLPGSEHAVQIEPEMRAPSVEERTHDGGRHGPVDGVEVDGARPLSRPGVVGERERVPGQAVLARPYRLAARNGRGGRDDAVFGVCVVDAQHPHRGIEVGVMLHVVGPYRPGQLICRHDGRLREPGTVQGRAVLLDVARGEGFLVPNTHELAGGHWRWFVYVMTVASLFIFYFLAPKVLSFLYDITLSFWRLHLHPLTRPLNSSAKHSLYLSENITLDLQLPIDKNQQTFICVEAICRRRRAPTWYVRLCWSRAPRSHLMW